MTEKKEATVEQRDVVVAREDGDVGQLSVAQPPSQPNKGPGYLVPQITGILAPAASQEEAQAGLDLALARLTGIQPKTGVESMLALQMVATHEAAIECLRRAMLPSQPPEGRELNLKHAVRLMGVYERQVAALDKHRGRGQQNVTVKYVHVAEGGQAIVGNVSRTGAEAVHEAGAAPALEAPTEMPVKIPPALQKVRAR